MSMFWIGDPYFPYRYLGRMIWYVWSTSYSWTQNCTQFFPFWILVANLSSTSASCLSSLLMGRVLLWKPWLHWGLGLQFFLCKYEIPCPSATILIRKESSGRFEFAPENGSATHTYIFLVRIRIHNSTYLHFLFFFRTPLVDFPPLHASNPHHVVREFQYLWGQMWAIAVSFSLHHIQILSRPIQRHWNVLASLLMTCP